LLRHSFRSFQYFVRALAVNSPQCAPEDSMS